MADIRLSYRKEHGGFNTCGPARRPVVTWHYCLTWHLRSSASLTSQEEHCRLNGTTTDCH